MLWVDKENITFKKYWYSDYLGIHPITPLKIQTFFGKQGYLNAVTLPETKRNLCTF